MTKKELLPLLIAHYEKVIKEVTDNHWNDTWYDVIKKYNVNKGICYCADKVFNTDIYGMAWVKNASDNISYWYMLPCSMVTKKQNLDRLQYRLDTMKKLIK
jgi:hypothetical protein